MATKAQLEQQERLRAMHRKYRNPPAERVETFTKTWKGKDNKLRSLDLDYVGHANLRDILCDEDPCWTWRALGTTEHGTPLIDRDGKGFARGLWIGLTVHGVEKPGYGTVEAGKHDAVKELIGDALRNAAQSFGIAIALWAKAELAELEEHQAAQPDDDEEAPVADAAALAATGGTAGPEVAPSAPEAPAAAPNGTAAPAVPEQPSEDAVRQELAKLIDAMRGDSIKAFQAYRAQHGLTGTDLRTITIEQAQDMVTFLRGQPVGRVA